MISNNELIRLARKLTEAAYLSDKCHEFAKATTNVTLKGELERTVSSMDDDICTLCHELRLAVRP